MIVEDIARVPTTHPDFFLGLFADGGSYNSGDDAKYAQILDLDMISCCHRNAFAFVLLAGMFFPRCDGQFDIRVIFFVEVAINGRSIVPVILAETFRGLTLYRYLLTSVLPAVWSCYTYGSLPICSEVIHRSFGGLLTLLCLG